MRLLFDLPGVPSRAFILVYDAKKMEHKRPFEMEVDCNAWF